MQDARSVRWGLGSSHCYTAVILLALQGPLLAQAPASEEFFEQKIRPVLVQHCYTCHSADAHKNKKLKGGLYVDVAEGLLTGGDTGPAIVKGKAAESLLIKANYPIL